MDKPAEAAALNAVKNYLLVQNRPYSANEVFENLHKEHGKTLVGKCLDCLVEQSVLREKLFGKQKIYYLNQEQLPVCSDEELQQLDVQIKEKTAELKELQQSVRSLESEIKLTANSLTNEQIIAKLKSINSEIEDYGKKLAELKELSKNISLDEKDKIDKTYERNVKEWRNRKRLANDILSTILENWPKKKKDLYDEIGVETDEDCKVVLP